VLARHGYDGSGHRARQFEPNWFDDHSLVIALDHGHFRTLRAWAPTPQARDRVHLLRSYDPRLRDVQDGSQNGWQLDVPDPYYDDAAAFEDVLGMVQEACQGLLDAVRAGCAD
jgi:protein-tyrosine phosphatase